MAINNYIYKINSKRNIIKYFEELFWMWYYIHTLNNPKDKLRVINQSQYFKDSMYKFIHSLFPKYTVIRIPAVGIPYSNPQYYDIPLGSIVNIWTGDLDELPHSMIVNSNNALSLQTQIAPRLFDKLLKKCSLITNLGKT